MFSVTYAQLNGWLTAFLWPFVRMLALVATAPVVGHAAVPVRVKIGLAAFMALVVAPTLGAMPDVTVFSAPGIWILVTQFLIGVAMGFTMQLVFAAVEAAGDFIGLSMGLGFATFFDPHTSGATPVMGRFLNAVAMLAFLAVDGHLQMFAALARRSSRCRCRATCCTRRAGARSPPSARSCSRWGCCSRCRWSRRC